MRLGVKAMESTVTEYDYTVRDNARIIQFRYNGSGLDPNPGRATPPAAPSVDKCKEPPVPGPLPTCRRRWRLGGPARTGM